MATHIEAPTHRPGHVGLREVGEMLIKHFGHHEGYFDVSVELGFAVAASDFPPHGRSPSAVVGIVGIGLVQVPDLGAVTLDASVVNPAQGTRTSRRSAKKAVR